jgi:hypothetical protein
MAALYPLCFFIVLLKQGVAHSVAKFPPFISEDLDTLLDLLRKALATSWPWSIFRCRSAAMVFNWSVSASKMLPRSSITFCATSAASLFLVSKSLLPRTHREPSTSLCLQKLLYVGRATPRAYHAQVPHM